MSYVRTGDPEAVREALPDEAKAVVFVPVYEAYEDFVQCFASIIAHTPTDVPVLLIDDGSVETRFRDFAPDVEHTVVMCRMAKNAGFVATVNLAFACAPRSDVIVVNSDVIVGPEWFERLARAAYMSSTVATASPLTNHGTLLSVGNGRNATARMLPDGVTPEVAARSVAERSPRHYPVIPTAIGHCTYFRRSALDVVGIFDEAFSPGYSEEVDFSQRAVAHGLVNVCADDVFVYHRGGSSFGRSEEVRRLVTEHDRLIGKRYPYYFEWVRQEGRAERSVLAASLLTAEAALRGMHVVVDGWCVGPTTMGSQIVVLETVAALAAHPQVSRVTAVVPRSIAPSSLSRLNACGAEVVIGSGPEHPLPEPAVGDLVYRPYQVTRMGELEWLRRTAPRVVVNQLDCIAYNDPAYFEDIGQWSTYRRVNELSTYLSDGVVFLSKDGVAQAGRSGLLSGGAVRSVVYAGVAQVGEPVPLSSPPVGMPNDRRGFFLCLGASYKHKNRLLALKIWAAARATGWEGDLVLAGPTPPFGNSLAEEDQFLLDNPSLRRNVWRLGSVTDEEKAWLYERASLVLYATDAEGFGLVPFEAASRGVPCLSTRAGSLDEVLPDDLPTIHSGDIDGAAALAVEMATNEEVRRRVCGSLAARAGEFTWAAVADRLVDCFWEVLRRQPVEPVMAGHLMQQPGLRVGREIASRRFSPAHQPLAWAVRQVADHPELRQYLIPPGSRRLRLGVKAVSFLEGRSR